MLWLRVTEGVRSTFLQIRFTPCDIVGKNVQQNLKEEFHMWAESAAQAARHGGAATRPAGETFHFRDWEKAKWLSRTTHKVASDHYNTSITYLHQWAHVLNWTSLHSTISGSHFWSKRVIQPLKSYQSIMLNEDTTGLLHQCCWIKEIVIKLTEATENKATSSNISTNLKSGSWRHLRLYTTHSYSL